MRFVAGVRSMFADVRMLTIGSSRQALPVIACAVDLGTARRATPAGGVAHVPIVCRWKKHASPRSHEGTKLLVEHAPSWLRGFVVHPPDRHSAGTPEGEARSGRFCRRGRLSLAGPMGWAGRWRGPGRPWVADFPEKSSNVMEIFLDLSFDHLYAHEMFDALTPPDLATPPRKGIGARIVRGLGRMGAALHGVVAGRLRAGRPVPSPRMQTGQPPPCRRGRRVGHAARRSSFRGGTMISRSPRRHFPTSARQHANFSIRRSRTAIPQWWASCWRRWPRRLPAR